MLDDSAGYVAIRDDAGRKSSLSINEGDFLRNSALRNNADDNNKPLRGDGRQAAELRKIRLQLGRWDNGAECTAQWGYTRVTSTCTAELVPPSPDHPNEGMVDFSVDLSPMAASEFRLAPSATTATGTNRSRGGNFADTDQKLQSNRILRCLERIILIGGALDTEALAVLPGKWVWKFHISLSVLDHGGNVLDACVLCAMATLRHYRKPHVDLQGQSDDPNAPVLPTMIPSMVKEATPLPLHHTPLSVSFGLIPAQDEVHSITSDALVAILADPTDREEYVQAGVVTIAMNIHSEICLLDYGGGCELTPPKLKECWTMGQPLVKELCRMLEETLVKADEQAKTERLERIKQQGGNMSLTTKHLALPDVSDEVLVQGADVPMDDAVRQAQNDAEEEYRRQALDFTVGHRATAVRENDDPALAKPQGGSLLASMLKSVQQQKQQVPTKGKEESGPPPAKEAPVELPPLPASEPIKPPVEPSKPSPKKQQSLEKAKPKPMDLESDEEEETTTMLMTEFQQAPPPLQAAPPAPPAAEAFDDDDDHEDITDLSMAIKSKKKKKKSSKKK
jgi:exosome complex component RRP45